MLYPFVFTKGIRNVLIVAILRNHIQILMKFLRWNVWYKIIQVALSMKYVAFVNIQNYCCIFLNVQGEYQKLPFIYFKECKFEKSQNWYDKIYDTRNVQVGISYWKLRTVKK